MLTNLQPNNSAITGYQNYIGKTPKIDPAGKVKNARTICKIYFHMQIKTKW